MGIKDLIRSAKDIKEQDDIEIPEWAPDVKFLVKGLPSGVWEQHHNRMSKLTVKTGGGTAEMSMRSNKAEIVAQALHLQDTGELVFPDLAEGISILSKKSGGIVGGLYDLVRHLSDEDKDFKGKVEAAEAGFSEGQS